MPVKKNNKNKTIKLMESVYKDANKWIGLKTKKA